MTSPSRTARAQKEARSRRGSVERILDDLRDAGEPESFVRFVADWMGGRVGEDPKAATVRARPTPKKSAAVPAFPSIHECNPTHGGNIRSDDPRRDAAADAACVDSPKPGTWTIA